MISNFGGRHSSEGNITIREDPATNIKHGSLRAKTQTISYVTPWTHTMPVAVVVECGRGVTLPKVNDKTFWSPHEKIGYRIRAVDVNLHNGHENKN